jgi:hypothetical protein
VKIEKCFYFENTPVCERGMEGDVEGVKDVEGVEDGEKVWVRFPGGDDGNGRG